jgi:23S rRNA (uracil1939-C5)-methyltransferase
MREPVRLQIDDLALDGKAVAHLEGKVVFLDAGLPGETVLAEITRSKPKYDQGRVLEIVERSPARITPPCDHFDSCGGCTWQDLDYAEQLRFKKQQVMECLARIGGLQDPLVQDVLPAPDIFGYRNKMEFSFHLVPEENSFRLGLHRRGRFDDIFDVHTCHLQSETANRVVRAVREFVAREQVPVYDIKQHRGYLRFLVIRQTFFTKQLMINLVTNLGDFPQAQEFVAVLLNAVPEITTIVHGQNDKKANVAIAEVENILHGPGFMEEEIMGRRFRIRANSFFQTNSAQAERLYRTAFDLLPPDPNRRLLDLYCGTGTIGLLLASQAAEVVGVELVADAVAMACENARINGIGNISFYEGHVRDFLAGLDAGTAPFDTVVIDPPRAGLHPKALKRLLALGAGEILYISCNPATFARDARELSGAGYRMSPVHPVDMFPHTRHIELVALFVR